MIGTSNFRRSGASTVSSDTFNGALVRPHDVTVSLRETPGSIEGMVSRVVHLGFEGRIELEPPAGDSARAQLTRGQTEELELARGDIVYVRSEGAHAHPRPPVHAPAGPAAHAPLATE
jgi:ABC-type sulfate/molybdate transport systems ATPase subunit